MKIVTTKKETVILTAQEKAILDKAYDILNDIAEDCEHTGDLWAYADDAAIELDNFLSEGKDNFIKIEPPVESVSTLVIEINH